ncbi:unnamed protein product [Ambrosiozyma monospora]|uniref:Unnamed protein product n=1 Tax=Ambrosiozyma monospora TaxID=43982 RepID=A0A9W6Z3P1_AMBMO|nr:unnamed protein product [Ambrosiozyma monospora]
MARGRPKGSKNKKNENDSTAESTTPKPTKKNKINKSNKPKMDIVSMLSRINSFEKEKESFREAQSSATANEPIDEANMDTSDDVIIIASNAVQLSSKEKDNDSVKNNGQGSKGGNPTTKLKNASSNLDEQETSESTTWSTLPDVTDIRNPAKRLRLDQKSKPSFSDKARSRLNKATKVNHKQSIAVQINEFGEIIPRPKKPIGRPRKYPKKIEESSEPIPKGYTDRPRKTGDENGESNKKGTVKRIIK